MGSEHPSISIFAATVLIVSLLIISVIALAFQVNTGGTSVKWEYSRNNEFGGPNNGYMALTVGSDGTIYFLEALSSWSPPSTGFNLLAVNPDGNLKWELDGVGLYGQYHERNGTLYYACNRNLKLIDQTGNILFDYVFMDGTISLCGEFQDGTALVRHDNSWEVYLSNYSIPWYDELVSISPIGKVQWTLDLTPFNASYFPNPKIGYNDTVLLFYEVDYQPFESGYDSDGNELWTMDITPTGAIGLECSLGRGPIFYFEYKHAINATTSILSVKAFDSRSGRISWIRNLNSTALLPTGNGWISPIYLDGAGVLYAFDIDNYSVCALNENGIVLWEESFPIHSSVLGACQDGGLLLLHYREDLTYEVLRVGSSGQILWKVKIATADGWTQPIVMGNDADFYYGEGRNLVAYQQSILNIFTIALAVSLILAIMITVFWWWPQIRKPK
jgi:hypothetical protein